MSINRRNFMHKAGFALASPLLFSELIACKTKAGSEASDSLSATNSTEKIGLDTYGIQLWTVKEDMTKDPKATLKAIASYGYKQIESCDLGKGIFWGMTPDDFKKFTSDLGLSVISSHCNPEFTVKKEKAEEFKKLADDAAKVGLKYLINPFPGELKTADEYKTVAEGLNKQGEICKSAGLRVAYHNHHMEFLPLEDKSVGEEILLTGTNADLVDFEMDLYWVVKAGQNPEEWLKKHNNRFKLAHIKDLYSAEKMVEIEAKEKATGFWPAGGSTELGKGRINFAQILKTAKENGLEYYIAEQERFDNSTPLDSAKLDAEYLKAFKFA
jgi:sugar phosphate isomerase/epimerase